MKCPAIFIMAGGTEFREVVTVPWELDQGNDMPHSTFRCHDRANQGYIGYIGTEDDATWTQGVWQYFKVS